MRIQRTTNYPDTSTSSDYPGEKKIQQTRQKQKKQQRQIMIQDTINNGQAGI
jgi:hypothetical protein